MLNGWTLGEKRVRIANPTEKVQLFGVVCNLEPYLFGGGCTEYCIDAGRSWPVRSAELPKLREASKVFMAP